MTFPLQAYDASFYNIDTETTHQAIGACCIFETPPKEEVFRSLVLEVMKLYPRMRMRVRRIAGKLCWEDEENFALENHLRFIADPNLNSTEDLISAVARDYSAGVPLDKPLWRFSLFSNTGFNKSENITNPISGMLFVVHHSFSDGLGGLEILNSLSRISASGTLVPEEELILAPSKNASSLRKGLKIFGGLLKILAEGATTRGMSPLNGANSSTRELQVLSVPLGSIREKRKQLGGSINDLLLTLVSGAVRNYHLNKKLPLRPLRALMPVSTRRISARHELGNHLTAVGVTLPLEPEAAQVRHGLIRNYVQSIKDNGSVLAYALFGEISSRLPAGMQRQLVEKLVKRANFICTNMPYSAKTQKIAGVPITKIYGMAALVREHGCAISFITYGDSICASIVSDPAIVKDASFLRDCFQREAEELLK